VRLLTFYRMRERFYVFIFYVSSGSDSLNVSLRGYMLGFERHFGFRSMIKETEQGFLCMETFSILINVPVTGHLADDGNQAPDALN